MSERFTPPPLVIGDRVRVIAQGVYGVIEAVDGEFLVVDANGTKYRRKPLGLRHCPTKEQIANKCRQIQKSLRDKNLRESLGLPRVVKKPAPRA